MAQQHISVTAAEAGKRLDQVLREHRPGHSRAALAELVAAGGVRVNGRRSSKGQVLAEGDVLSLEAAGELGPAPDPSLALQVLYEDRWLVAVDKPAGLPTHALRPGELGTLTSGLLARYPEMAGVGYRALEPGILHRLDTETSGVLLAARDASTFAALRLAHERGELAKTYLALCSGQLRAPQVVAGFLRADQRKVRVEAQLFPRAKPVELELLQAEALGGFSLVRVRVAFAARHQVRAQLAAVGHPIAGDATYAGEPLPGLQRHFLHASDLQLQHPVSGEALRLHAPLPAALEAVLAGLRTAARAG